MLGGSRESTKWVRARWTAWRVAKMMRLGYRGRRYRSFTLAGGLDLSCRTETDGTIQRRCCAVVAVAVRLSSCDRQLHLLLPVADHVKVVVLIPKVHGVRATGCASNGEAVSSWRRWRRRLAMGEVVRRGDETRRLGGYLSKYGMWSRIHYSPSPNRVNLGEKERFMGFVLPLHVSFPCLPGHPCLPCSYCQRGLLM